MSSNQNEQNQEEQTFNILPHPATSNNPTQETTPGLGSAPTLQPGFSGSGEGSAEQYGGRGNQPHVISQEIAQGLEQPKSREELQQIQAKLNE
ncbi:hypothetical protein JCM11251_002794 [Rhodosporidiobolus azoricus]